MIVPSPDTSRASVPQSSAPVVLRIILAALLAIPGIIGLCVVAGVTFIWLDAGMGYASGDREWMPLFLIPALGFIVFSVTTIGFILRYARWKKAHVASLVLSIIAAVSLVLGHQLMLDAIGPDDTESRTEMLAASIFGLLVAAGPTFLHWWRAKKKADTPRK